MKNGWEEKKLMEVCEIENERNNHNNIPFVGMEDIESNTARFLGSRDPRNVKSSSFYFNEEHILYGRLRPYLNKVLLPDFEGHCSTEIFPIRTKHPLNKRFLFYWITSDEIVQKINSTCTGTRMPRANMKEVMSFEIPLPPLPEQQRIVAVLDAAFATIGAAIENAENNLRNARELFESYLESVDAEKELLSKLVNITTGKLDVNAATENGQYPFFTCSREVYAIDKYAFDCEAILLAGNNAVGDFNVKHYQGKFNAYQRTYVITVNKESRILYRYLYYQLLKSLKEFKKQSVGVGTKFLKLGMINNLGIALPSLIEQQSVVSKLDALSSETKKLEAIYQKKLADLDELKKSVLQKAFNGELIN